MIEQLIAAVGYRDCEASLAEQSRDTHSQKKAIATLNLARAKKAEECEQLHSKRGAWWAIATLDYSDVRICASAQQKYTKYLFSSNSFYITLYTLFIP